MEVKQGEEYNKEKARQLGLFGLLACWLAWLLRLQAGCWLVGCWPACWLAYW